MKKTFTALTVIILCSCVSAFAVEKNFDGKIGGAYAMHPDRVGLNLEFDYLWALDPYFAVGTETGLFWINWEEKRGSKELGTDVSADVKAQTNAFVVPVLGVAQLRLPNIKDKINILPYVSLGLGLSLMPISYSDPTYTDNNAVVHKKRTLNQFYAGFTWKVVAGAAYSPSGSKIDFIAETGYVGSSLERGNNSMNMSRMILNVGVRFPFDK
jgi:hypothetical protein